jgi:hypothetical protein
MAKSRRLYSLANSASVETLKSRVPSWDSWGDLAPKALPTVAELTEQGYASIPMYAAAGSLTLECARTRLLRGKQSGSLESALAQNPIRGRTPVIMYRPKKAKK